VLLRHWLVTSPTTAAAAAAVCVYDVVVVDAAYYRCCCCISPGPAGRVVLRPLLHRHAKVEGNRMNGMKDSIVN